MLIAKTYDIIIEVSGGHSIPIRYGEFLGRNSVTDCSVISFVFIYATYD